MVYRAIAGNGGRLNITITRLFYILSVLIIVLISLDLINNNLLQANTVIVLLITYINGTNGILNLGKAVQSMTEMYSRITDLFEYIRGFGRQSFPVVED